MAIKDVQHHLQLLPQWTGMLTITITMAIKKTVNWSTSQLISQQSIVNGLSFTFIPPHMPVCPPQTSRMRYSLIS